jgi:hypothetical protein
VPEREPHLEIASGDDRDRQASNWTTLQRTRRLHGYLLGEGVESKAAVLLSSSVWDLHLDPDTLQDVPALLLELADEVLAADEPAELALRLGRDLPDQETRFLLMRSLAQRLGSEVLGQAALATVPVDWTALAAALSEADNRGEADWATSTLRTLSTGASADRLPQMVRFTQLTPQRIALALDAVDTGRADGGALGQLLYGARVADLPERLTLRIVRVVAESGHVQEAMGMFDQWLARGPEISDEVRDMAISLARDGVGAGRGGMVEHYMDRLVSRNVLRDETFVSLWEDRMVHRTGLATALDRTLTERALVADAHDVANRMVALIRRQASGEGTFGLYASGDLGLLSQAAEALSVDEVWDLIRDLPERELRWAMHHMHWWGNAPDPLVRRLLLSDRLPDVESEASVCFFNTLGTVSGSLAAMERELTRAQSWQESLTGTSAAEWAARLVVGYERHIEFERLREEEEFRS